MGTYRERLKEKGLKQKFVAEQLGISEVTLNNKLSGKTNFTKAEKFALEAILRGEKIEIE